jgi:hypothetical protein
MDQRLRNQDLKQIGDQAPRRARVDQGCQYSRHREAQRGNRRKIPTLTKAEKWRNQQNGGPLPREDRFPPEREWKTACLNGLINVNRE